MSIFSTIKKEFAFLEQLYVFRICDKQTHGAYYYITWDNSNVKIKVLYDVQDNDPMHIFIYDSNSLGTVYDVDEYTKEFVIKDLSYRRKIHQSAEWLKCAIKTGIIRISSEPSI